MKILSFLLTCTAYLNYVFAQTKCNFCNDPVNLNLDEINVSYKLCKFETAFEINANKPTNWLFLGIECDDKCDNNNSPGEGLYCDNKGNLGYYEITNGVLGETFNKIEFNEAECKFTDNSAVLKVDRYMPNLWLRNQTISYYVLTDNNQLNFNTKIPKKFNIVYKNKDPIIVSDATNNKYNKISLSIISFFAILFLNM